MTAVASPRTPVAAPPAPAPAAAPPAAAPPAVPVRVAARAPARRRGRLHRIEGALFPVRGSEHQNPQGVPEPGKPELLAYLVSLAIGAIGAIAILIAMAPYALPSGGDPGEWITSSYPYVGLPYPTWIVPGQYPPLLFPLLGSLVRLLGPVQAGRGFVVLMAILLGLSSYFLARSVVRSRSVALAAEGFVVLSPTLIQMFFWGGYPNLLGLVFFNLSLGFFLRFVRSAQPTHAFLFWVATAATVLTHSLVATILGGTLLVVFVFVVWQRWLPRTFYRSRAALAGLGVFVASVGGFYLLTRLAGVPHPQYLQTSAFAYVKSGIVGIYSVIVNPYVPGFRPSVVEAEIASFVIAGLILFVLVGLRLLAPARLTLGLLLVLAMFGTVIGGAIVGWELSVVTDYLRFGYFLVVPLGLGLALIVDELVHASPRWFANSRRELRHTSRAAVGAAPSVEKLPPLHPPSGPGRWTTFGIAAFAIFIVALVLSAGLVTYPSLATQEQLYSASFHDTSFLSALHDIRDSGVAGNVFTVGGAAKWTRAILDRNAYTPFIATRYTFDPTHLDYEELAYFAMVAHDTVTNSLVAATIAGANATFDNVTPDYQASYFGVFTPVATILPQIFNVSVSNRTTTLIESVTGNPHILPPTDGRPDMTLVYPETGFNLSIGISLATGLPTAQYTIQVIAAPGWIVQSLRGNVTGPSVGIGATTFRLGATAGDDLLNPAGLSGGLLTYLNATPANVFDTHPQLSNHQALVSRQGFLVYGGPRGTSVLNLTLTFTTPGAQNLVNNLPPFVDTPDVWQNWSIRFVLLTNQSQFLSNHPSAIFWDVPYLEGEFGAKVLSVEGSWTVLLLPASES
ncbi:MAG: hypothetical protein L3K18_02610 [Thermoplasmata archaeon]|nr:hypothetical protein [Thermoplasmata archaeon]